MMGTLTGSERSRVAGRRGSWLKLGTCLTGTAAALLAGATTAHASPYHFGARTIVAHAVPAAIQTTPLDLTVRRESLAGTDVVVSEGDLSTSGDDMPAISTQSTGTTIISAGAITTSGARSSGIVANGSGAITINVDGVQTTGDFAYGVRAVAGDMPVFDPATGIVTLSPPADLTVTAGTIATGGFGADGVYAANLTTGTTNVNVSTVSTQGAQAWGVNANGGGDVNVNVGYASTYGFNGVGIGAGSHGGNVSVTANSVYTSGDSSVGILAQATSGYDADHNRVNGNVTVTAGSVSTGADYSTGIRTVAEGNTTINADYVTTHGAHANGISATGNGAVSITTSRVLTTGDYSHGIYAVADGDVAINGVAVTTQGANSIGVYAHSLYGGASIDVSQISTQGEGSAGAVALAAGNIHVAADSIQSTGLGVYALTTGGDIDVSTGTVTTRGEGAAGIVAFNYSESGKTSVTAGSVATSRDNSAGIIAQGFGDVSVQAGKVTTSGYSSLGILGYSVNGSVSVTADTVKTAGEYSTGITVSNLGINQASTVKAGDIEVSGDHSSGVQVIALTGGANIDVGTVTTDGFFGSGINVNTNLYGYQPADGNVQTIITADTIKTSGNGAVGVAVQALGDVSINIGSITTTGDMGAQGHTVIFSEGISTNVAVGDTNITVGSITTSGRGSIGMQTYDYLGNTTIDVGTIATSGIHSTGILSRSHYGDIDITAGTITTTGDSSGGIAARAYGSVYQPGSNVTINAGTISTSGASAAGIVALSPYGDVNVDVTHVTTAGDSSMGVYAYGNHANVQAGTVTTSGADSIGIYAAGLNGVTVAADSIATLGDGAIGVIAQAAGPHGAVSLNLDSVSTQGSDALGVVAVSGEGTIDLKAGSVTTTGAGSVGVAAYATYGAANVNVGTVSTSGIKSAGLIVEGATNVSINAGTVSTKGDNANGIVIRSGSYGIGGTGTVVVDKVTTAGNVTAGIDAIATGDADHASSLNITANSIITTGQDAVGISAFADYGPLAIKVGSITTKGAESSGILAWGGGDLAIQAGSITSVATSIYTREGGVGTLTLGVTGKIASSGDTGIVAINDGGKTAITIGSGGSVQGAGDAIAVQSGGGAVSIANAGTITGGTSYAIDVSRMEEPSEEAARTASTSSKLASPIATSTPATTVTNSGTITGAVRLSGGDDTVTNSGTFVATKDSDFGTGNDLFVNSGTVRLASASGPAAIKFLGLEKFENSGLVDLRNGTAGDTLTLPGSYVGSGKATLGLDVGANGTADKFVVTGAATGTTSILINGSAANATLLLKAGTLVQTGAGSSANAFNIANGDVGFVRYGVSFDAATNSFQLTTSAGSAVRRFTKVSEAAQSIWRKSADAWSSHMAELRDAALPDSRVWGQAYGAVDSRHGHEDGDDIGYRQDYYGFQSGIDLAGKRLEDGQGLVFGLTGGYLSSHVNFRAGANRVRFDTINGGAYAALRAGPLFANLLGQYDHYRADAGNSSEHWSDHFNGNGYGAQAEVGARLGGDGFFAEPVASLAWQKTDLGTLHALGQSIDFDNGSGLTGRIGARIGGTGDIAGGGKAVFYARAAYVHSFHGRGSAVLESGGISDSVAGVKLGDYGEGVLGVNLLTAGRLSGFLEGDADIGSAYKGGGGRVGIRFKL